jgi:hypothetical protein
LELCDEPLKQSTPQTHMSEINPQEFGALTAQVNMLERQVTDLQADMKQLLELANKSKGGLWVGMAISSALGALATWLASHIRIG